MSRLKKEDIFNKKNVILAVLIVVTVITSIVILNNKETALKGNITIWTDNSTYDYLNEVASEFVKDNEKCKINILKMDEDNYKANLMESFRKNKLPDLIAINTKDIDSIIEDENLESKMKDCSSIINKNGSNLSKRDLQSVIRDNKSRAIPFTSNPILLYLREDMLNQYGYSNKDFNTWDDVISIGKDIYAKSEGKVKILNSVGEDRQYIVSLLIMQIMDEYKSKGYEISSEEIKIELNKRYTELLNDNILNTNENGSFLARIASIEAMNELSAIDAKCQWTANYVPSVSEGTNKFFIENKKSFIYFDNGNQKEVLINKFISYISDNKLNSKLLTKQRFFLSYISAYSSGEIDNTIKNFSGRSPLVLMSNVEKKAPEMPEYNLYNNIKSEINY